MQLLEPGPVGPDRLRLAELPDPVPRAGQLLVAVAACAVCRTDLQIASGDLAARRLPIVLGHQAVGTVLQVGPDVEAWAVGERIGAYWLASADGTCRFCRSGRENLCERAQFTGWDVDGGYADRLLVRADTAVRIPGGFADHAAAPLLCAGVIGYRALRVSGIQHGGRLGLFGFGSSGQLTIQIARHWGCEVHVRTRSARDQARALELGAASAGPSEEPTPPLDAAITTAPVGSVVIAALRSLDRGGIVAINAIHLDGIPAFDYDELWLERQIRSVANVTRRDATEFIELAAAIAIVTETTSYPLQRAGDALADLAAGAVRGTAVLDVAG
jgi:propanol-preferring alcohol dehydrogenase